MSGRGQRDDLYQICLNCTPWLHSVYLTVFDTFWTIFLLRVTVPWKKKKGRRGSKRGREESRGKAAKRKQERRLKLLQQHPSSCWWNILLTFLFIWQQHHHLNLVIRGSRWRQVTTALTKSMLCVFSDLWRWCDGRHRPWLATVLASVHARGGYTLTMM